MSPRTSFVSFVPLWLISPLPSAPSGVSVKSPGDPSRDGQRSRREAVAASAPERPAGRGGAGGRPEDHARGALQAAGHGQLPGAEDAALGALPRPALPAPLRERAGAL